MNFLGFDGRSGAEIKVIVAEKKREAEELRAALKAADRRHSDIVTRQLQFLDMVEAQDAELSRILRNGDSSTEDAVNDAQRLAKHARTMADSEREKQVLLQRAQSNILGRDDDSDTYRRSDSPGEFKLRLDKMVEGAVLQMFEKDEFIPVFVSLTDDCSALQFASDKGKKVFRTLPIDDIDQVVYPTRTYVQRKKKQSDLGKDYMKVTLEASGQASVQLLLNDKDQLVTWILGFQNLAAKPGQGLWNRGYLFWKKVRAQLIQEADLRGVSPHKILADFFAQMLPPPSPEPETVLIERPQDSQTDKGAEAMPVHTE